MGDNVYIAVFHDYDGSKEIIGVYLDLDFAVSNTIEHYNKIGMEFYVDYKTEKRVELRSGKFDIPPIVINMHTVITRNP